MAMIPIHPSRLLLIAATFLATAMPFAPAQTASAHELVPGSVAMPASGDLLSSPPADAASTIHASGSRVLAEEEAAGLQFMIQEEKLAHDLYLAFYGQWGLPVFDRIAASESTHMAAVARLLEMYGAENPVSGAGVGSFADPALQALYDQLLAQGSASARAALSAAVVVEETDIADLQVRLEATDEPAIQRVYARLLRGSTRHLSTFSRQSDRLTETDLSAPRSGQPGMGQGRGGSGSGRWSR